MFQDQEKSNSSNKPAPNPLLSLTFDNKWEPAWDQSLQSLLLKFSYDFDTIASQMNQIFQTSAFSSSNCQGRWEDLQRSKLEKDSDGPSDQERIERLMRLSAPPYEDPRKKMTLQELEDTLPMTRSKKDFLDPTKTDFDKETDLSITGERIKPSGFNILTDRIRPTEDERKLKEAEFLKSLEQMTFGESDDDTENPFVFKAVFGENNKFELEKLPFDNEEAKKRLDEKVDMTQFSRMGKGVGGSTFENRFEKTETFQPELRPSMPEFQGKIKFQQDKEESEGSEEDTGRVNFMKMFDNPVNINDALKALQMLEENSTLQKSELGFLDEFEEEVDQKLTAKLPQPIEATQTKTLIEQIQSLEVPESKKISGDFKPSSFENKPIVQETIKPKEVIEPKKEENIPKKTEKKELSKETKKSKQVEELAKMSIEERRARLLQDFSAREVKEGEDSDVSEEDFFENQRTKILAKTEELREKQEEQGENTTKSVERKQNENEVEVDKESKELDEEEKKRLEEEDEKAAEERLKELIKSTFVLKEKKVETVKPQENEEEEEVIEDEEERKEREELQKKLNEQGMKLGYLLKEESLRDREEEKARLEEEARREKEREVESIAERQKERKREVEDLLKDSWTNSFIGSDLLFDEKISYLKSIPTLPWELQHFFQEKALIKDEDRYLARFQMLCLPIFSNMNNYLKSLLDYFLIFSNFNVSPLETDKGFPFKLIAFGMFARLEGERKKSLEQIVHGADLTEYFYVLFDTQENRSTSSFEEAIKKVSLETLFGEQVARSIKKELGQMDQNLKLKDIVIFHYRNMEIVDETFNTRSPLTGLCVHKTEVEHINDYETAVVLAPIVIREQKNVEKGKEKGSLKSNVKSLFKKISKENLQVVGLKSVYLNKEDLDNFKYKVGTLPVSEAQPFVAIAVAGYQAIEKIKSIIGSNDVVIAKRLEPKSVNARYAVPKTEGVQTILSPSNNSAAKKWLGFFFGGRISQKDISINAFEDQIQNLKKTPWNYQILTRPIQKIGVLISSKFGNKNLPSILGGIIDKSFTILDVQTFTKTSISNAVKNLDKAASPKYKTFSDKFDFENFNTKCSETNNSSNYFLLLQGTNPSFLYRHLCHLLSLKTADQNNHLFKLIEEEDHLQLLMKIFHQSHAKSEVSTLTQTKALKYYFFLQPIETSKEIQHACLNTESLLSLGFEVLGCELFHKHKLHPVRSFIENGIIQSTKVSQYVKKRKEFLNFVERCVNYLENQTLFCSILRWQDPLKTSEDLIKNPISDLSNLSVSENVISALGQEKSSETEIKYFVEKFILEYSLDDVLALCNQIPFVLSDDRTLKESFVFDLPVQNETSPAQSSVSTVLLISKNTVSLASLSFIVKFFENKDFTIQQFSLIKPTADVINKIGKNHDNFEAEEKENWPRLEDKLKTEPFWAFLLSKSNAIFECKKIIYELLKKIDSFSGSQNQGVEKDLPYVYGVYFCRSFEDSKGDREVIDWYFRKQRAQFLENENLKMKQIQSTSATTESAIVVLRNKPSSKNDIFEYLDIYSDHKIKILNNFIVSVFTEQDKEALIEVFKTKHNAEALSLFLNSGSSYFVTQIEYKLGTSMNEVIGSFRMKAPEQLVTFSRGQIIKKYGCEVLHSSQVQDVEKIAIRFFGCLDSEHLQIE